MQVRPPSATLQAEDGIPTEAWEPGTAAPPGGDVWGGCSLPAACQVASVVSDSLQPHGL